MIPISAAILFSDVAGGKTLQKGSLCSFPVLLV